MVERWILARLRNRRLFGLEEANSAVREPRAALNTRPMRRLGTSRLALFESLERAALLQLPPEPYAYADWRRCRVGLDEHVEVLGQLVQLPHRLARAMVKARITERSVELFHNGIRVAAQRRR